MGFPRPAHNVVIDYFSHSCQECKTDIKRTLNAISLDYLALTLLDVIDDLLPEWACLTLQNGTTFRLLSNLADIPFSRVRNHFPIRVNFGYEYVCIWRYKSPASCNAKNN